MVTPDKDLKAIIEKADSSRKKLASSLQEQMSASAFAAAEELSAMSITREKEVVTWDSRLDSILSSRILAFPIMILILSLVFWLTIEGANIPSEFLSGLLLEKGGLKVCFGKYFSWKTVPWFFSMSLYEVLHKAFEFFSAPEWLSGFFVDGVYLAVAWVVSVMLPPMAIFFPLFTFLEDLGYLPRVAFNLDRIFRAVGAHGKQSLTMAMGFGCNAAGVIACRIIESPRERLIAILTNNFVPCNGRWPTLILAAVLVSTTFSVAGNSFLPVFALTCVTLLGIIVTFLVSWLLSKTLLAGEPSGFVLEMPPFRLPKIGWIIYKSIIDRTLFVLTRAIVCAAPAGGLIWILGAVKVGDSSLFHFLAAHLHPLGKSLGLDGVILLAFIFAFPANEIVVPTIIMGYMNLSKMTGLENPTVLFIQNGWTWLTAVCLMLFSLLHYPCSTVTWTIWAETKSLKWTVLANVIPLSVALLICFIVAQSTYFMGWV
ncbi:nucleoside recognition domain-containing protein [Candidatus Riflebacteria bacterium]